MTPIQVRLTLNWTFKGCRKPSRLSFLQLSLSPSPSSQLAFTCHVPVVRLPLLLCIPPGADVRWWGNEELVAVNGQMVQSALVRVQEMGRVDERKLTFTVQMRQKVQGSRELVMPYLASQRWMEWIRLLLSFHSRFRTGVIRLYPPNPPSLFILFSSPLKTVE